MTKFFSALAILVIVMIAQAWLASAGIFLNLALAALIAFAFIFNLWETIFFILVAIFFLNWQPAPSRELAVIALMPLIAFTFHRFINWQPWIGILAMTILGFAALYIAAAPAMFFADFRQLLLDLAVGIVFGEAMFFILF